MIGPVVTNMHVQEAARSLFTARVGVTPNDQSLTSYYLNELGSQLGRGDLPDFRSVSTSNDADIWPEDQLPAAIVICPGLAAEPRKRSNGWSARWALGLGAVVSAGTRSDTLDLIGIYTAAMRAMILQHPSLGSFAAGTYWSGERYDELLTQDERTIAAGQVIFVVDVDAVVDSRGGPSSPISIEKVLISVSVKED